MEILGMFLAVPLILIGLALFAFWVWMLVECATKEPNTGNEKLCWIVVIVFTQILGALIYFFVRRPNRNAMCCCPCHINHASPMNRQF
jgi:hypothetical protein